MKPFKITLSKDSPIFWPIPKDKAIFWPIIFSILILAASLIFTLLKFTNLPPKIPLFYSKPWGQDRLVGKGLVWLLPAILFLLILVNTILAKVLAPKIIFLAQIISIALSILAFLIFFTLARIIFLVL